MRRRLVLAVVILLLITFSILNVNGARIGSSRLKIQRIQNSVTSYSLGYGDFYFVHITDPHVMFDGGKSNNNLKSVLSKIRRFRPKPAFVVLTGDIAEWGTYEDIQECRDFAEDFYKSLRKYLYLKDKQLYLDREYEVPVYTCPGNHDHIGWQFVEGSFPIPTWTHLKNYYEYVRKSNGDFGANYYVEYGNTLLVFIDSGRDKVDLDDISFNNFPSCLPSDGLSDKVIDFLENVLKTHDGFENKIICMHHPVIYNGKTYISKNRDRFLSLCNKYNVDLVLSGHIHSSYTEQYNGCMFVTTSDIKRDKSAFRVIKVEGDKLVVQDEGIQPSVEVSIVQPSPGLYIYGRKILPLPGDEIIALGSIRIYVEISMYLDKVDKVEFYVNDVLRETICDLDSNSCSWEFKQFGWGLLWRVKVVVYDELITGAGYIVDEDTITVLKW